MRIAIDISSAVKPERTGIANSIINLVKAISELDCKNEYLLCCRLSRLKYFQYLPQIKKDNFRLKIIQEPFNIFFPRQVDIYHSGGTRLPAYQFSKTIVTIPDVLLLLSDEYTNKNYRKKKLKRYYESAHRATRIKTVSNFSKKEIVKHLQVPEDKIDAIYHGVDEKYYPRSNEEIFQMKKRYGLEGDYILYVGIITRRKNVVRMLEAFRIALDQLKCDLSLVMAGRFSLGKEEFLQTMERLSLRSKVKLLGYFPGEDLPALYSGAKIFFFPSLYEGFGNPVLESMACGTPVITSNIASLPEVAGDAAMLVDPYNIEVLADSLVKLIEDSNLRNKLIEKGLIRAKSFSWSKAAQAMMKVYEKLK